MVAAGYDILTFDGFLKHWTTERPDWAALSQDNAHFTYAQLEERTAKIANMVLGLGLKKGDRVAWIGKNSDLYFALFYGAARVGIVMVPVGWRLAPAEWAYIAKDTGARVLFAGQGFEAGVQALGDQTATVERIIGEDEARQMIDVTPRAPFDAAGPDDAALQLYTSGTTGNPKGAVLSNRNLFALRKNAAEEEHAYSKWDDDEVVLIAMPCAHIGGTGLGIMALASGLPALVQAEFTPDSVFDGIEKGGATRLFIVPAALQMMVNHPRCRDVDYSRLRYILYGAAPIPLELLRQCMDVFSAEFIQVYGMTETTGTICMLPPEDHDPNGNKRMRSAGKPLPGVELRVVDGAGNDVPVGDVGEI
jgi:acyl-CoA synthetase (AMP-forming)/AMP-acid ligase II